MLKLGANVVAIGSKGSGDVVSTGIVTEFKALSDTEPSIKNILTTDMALSSTLSGFLLFDSYGKLVAFEKGLDETDKTPLFLDAAVIKNALSGLI